MKALYMAIVIIISSACKQTEQKQYAILPPPFDNEFTLDTNVKFQKVRNAANGYDYSYPSSFIKVADTIGQVDSFVLYSPDNETKIKFFVEGDTRRNEHADDETEKRLFKHYFDSLTNSKHSFTTAAKIVKSTYSFKNYAYGKPAGFMLLGEKAETEFLMKTELSEVPIHGDLTFKTFSMEYPKRKKSYFRPIALEIAQTFGQ